MKKITFFKMCTLFCAGLFAGSAAAQTTFYVKPIAEGYADGSSWENAAADLQAVINSAVAGDNIFVAGGVYKPNRKANDLTVITENNRDNAFVLKEGIKLYGGFAGTETSPEERDLAIPEYQTTLSGDFNNDDVTSGAGALLIFENNTENAHHVVIALGTEETPVTAATVLDGFYIIGGNAKDAATGNLSINGQNVGRYTGGGIALYNYASPTLANINVYANTAEFGGGIYCRNHSDPKITTAMISGNFATSGGGICNWDTSSPVIAESSVLDNLAVAGGGFYNYQASSPVLNYVTISNNSTNSGAGGGMYNYYSSPELNYTQVTGNNAVTFGGGICNWSHCETMITGGSVTENTADNGGGIYNNDYSAPVVNGTAISLNTATENGGGIYSYQNSVGTYMNFSVDNNSAAYGAGILCNQTASPAFTNGIIKNNTATGNGGGLGTYNQSDPIYTNCLIVNNMAQKGGGIYCSNSAPFFTNITLTDNLGIEGGGGIACYDGFPDFRNSIIYGNSALSGSNIAIYNTSNPVYSYSLVEYSSLGWSGYGTDGGNNIDADPLFTDVESGDYTLELSSLAVNAGSNTFFAEGQQPDLSAITTDLSGEPRIFENTVIDMGAYEVQAVMALQHITKTKIICYPNPVTDKLIINSPGTIHKINVYNSIGSIVFTSDVNRNNAEVNFGQFNSGMYILTIETTNSTETKTIVKR